jgi:hypothetical protein
MIHFQTNLAYCRVIVCSCILICLTTLTGPGTVALELRPDCCHREVYCTSIPPVRGSMLRSKTLYHLPQHCILVRSETSVAMASQFLKPCLLHPIHHLVMFAISPSSGQCWAPRHCATYPYILVVRRGSRSPCEAQFSPPYVFTPHPPACYLRLQLIHPYMPWPC